MKRFVPFPENPSLGDSDTSSLKTQVYFGDIGSDSSVIREYLARHGAVCPDNVNPAEYGMLDSIGAGLTPRVGDRD